MSSSRKPLKSSPFVVHGVVRRPSLAGAAGPPVSGVKVQVYQQDIAKATLLKEATTDADGVYSATFTVEQPGPQGLGLPGPDTVSRLLPGVSNAPQPSPETGVNIWVGVPAGDGKTYLVQSQTYFNAAHDLQVDLVLPYVGSEIERHSQLILPRLRGIALEALTPAQLDFLSRDAVVGSEMIRSLFAAATLAKTTNHPELLPAFYGLVRTRNERTLPEILALGASVWRTSLASAFQRNALPQALKSQADGWIDALTEYQAQQALTPSPAKGGGPTQASLGDLIASLPDKLAIDPSLHLAIAKVWMADASRGDTFWNKVTATGISAAQTAALKTTVALNDLAQGNLKLVQALQASTPAEPDGGLRHFAALAPNDWIQIAATGAAETDSLAAIESRARVDW